MRGAPCWAGGLACRRAAGCAQPGARAAPAPGTAPARRCAAQSELTALPLVCMRPGRSASKTTATPSFGVRKPDRVKAAGLRALELVDGVELVLDGLRQAGAGGLPGCRPAA